LLGQYHSVTVLSIVGSLRVTAEYKRGESAVRQRSLPYGRRAECRPLQVCGTACPSHYGVVGLCCRGEGVLMYLSAIHDTCPFRQSRIQISSSPSFFLSPHFVHHLPTDPPSEPQVFFHGVSELLQTSPEYRDGCTPALSTGFMAHQHVQDARCQRRAPQLGRSKQGGANVGSLNRRAYRCDFCTINAPLCRHIKHQLDRDEQLCAFLGRSIDLAQRIVHQGLRG
jgi:hypothetical protein